MKQLSLGTEYHNISSEMTTRYNALFTHSIKVFTAATVLSLAIPAQADSLVTPYVSFGNGYGIVDGASLVVTQRPGDVPYMRGEPGCCPEGGYALDFRLGAKMFDLVAIEGGVVGQGWNLGEDSRGGAGFGGGGFRLYLLSALEKAIGDFGLPIELSLGSLFGYTILGKDFAYTGFAYGFDGTLEWAATSFFSVAFRLNVFTPIYDTFVYTDFDGEQGRCLDAAGVNSVASPIHAKGTMDCSSGSSPEAAFLSPQLVLNFYLDVF